jgi:hypothetical protein
MGGKAMRHTIAILAALALTTVFPTPAPAADDSR